MVSLDYGRNGSPLRVPVGVRARQIIGNTVPMALQEEKDKDKKGGGGTLQDWLSRGLRTKVGEFPNMVSVS